VDTLSIPDIASIIPGRRHMAASLRAYADLEGDGLSESRGVLRGTGPVVRFAARAQQPATLNRVIEATTSVFVKGFG
jgi:hypothetical protein